MSPAPKSKSKDKRATCKDPQKSSTKTTSNSITGGYNPLLGTFHTLDTNVEDHSGNSVEYDSVSNNGSWSGESEDHKEKTSQGPARQETSLPGVDNDKREKIRQKNEKKHQRQKERRAQELHERCSGYLMSRKLEALAQQLVAMGFSSERATMALILNEGRVEQSVAWLFEGGEDADNHVEGSNLDGGGNLKIDITEELAWITEMERKFKCSKQEVERAIVACEGDLDQAAETLKNQKPEPSAAPPKVEDSGQSSTVGNVSGNGNGKLSVAMGQNLSTSRTQPKNSIHIQQKTDETDYIYSKMGVTVGLSGGPGIKSLQLLKKTSPTVEPTVEKRWPVGVSNPSVSYSLAAPPPAKTESRYATDLKNLQLGSVREPVIVMQRPKSKNIPASVTSDWHPSVVEPGMNVNPNGFSHAPTSTRSFSTQSYGYEQFQYPQQPLPQKQYGPLDHHFSQQGSMNRMAPTPTLAAASSLGLFSGLGSNGWSGPSSPVDWNAGDSSQFDYTNIDWSLDRLPHSTSRRNGMWMGWGSSTPSKTAMRPPTGVLSNGNNGPSMGLHPDGVGPVASEASGGGSHDWTSPFEERELFSFPRQFVSSPSL